jgi:hypothetical protein
MLLLNEKYPWEDAVMPLGNHTWNLGDITSDIYFDRLTRQDGPDVPFIRLIMMINGNKLARAVYGLRVVAYGALAELAYGHLQKSSRIGIEGHIQVRERANNQGVVFEIVADRIEFIRNIDYARGYETIAMLKSRERIKPQEGRDLQSLLAITCGYSEGDDNLVTVY